jgi:hypothetical protein
MKLEGLDKSFLKGFGVVHGDFWHRGSGFGMIIRFWLGTHTFLIFGRSVVELGTSSCSPGAAFLHLQFLLRCLLLRQRAQMYFGLKGFGAGTGNQITMV